MFENQNIGHPGGERSDATALGRTAAVVRHRRNVADAADLDASGGEGADRGLTAGAGTGDAHIDRADTVVASCVGCTDGGLLRGERGSLAGATEAKRTRRLPAQRVASLIGDGDDGVVERGLNEDEAKWNILAFTLLEFLILAGLCCALRILCLRHVLFRRFLLTGNGSLTWAFAGASVGVGALTANRKAAAVAKTTVGLDFNEALDVERDVLAEIAFDLTLGFNNLTDAVQRVFIERANLRDRINVRLREDLGGARVADSEDIGESDARLFVVRDIDSSNTCHGVPFRLSSVASPRERGEWVCGESVGFNASLDFG
jgi:hypothetical protein